MTVTVNPSRQNLEERPIAYFAVSYQLNRAKNYQPLWDEMERLGAQKAMRSFYLLDLTNESATEVKNHLTQFVDDVDDMIFVARMDAKPAAHRCYKGTTDWINARF